MGNQEVVACVNASSLPTRPVKSLGRSRLAKFVGIPTACKHYYSGLHPGFPGLSFSYSHREEFQEKMTPELRNVNTSGGRKKKPVKSTRHRVQT